jgi:hypothetical protein
VGRPEVVLQVSGGLEVPVAHLAAVPEPTDLVAVPTGQVIIQGLRSISRNPFSAAIYRLNLI